MFRLITETFLCSPACSADFFTVVQQPVRIRRILYFLFSGCKPLYSLCGGLQLLFPSASDRWLRRTPGATGINTLWKTLFHKKTHPSKGMRISELMSTGAGMLDGLFLGWKLYRKFKEKRDNCPSSTWLSGSWLSGNHLLYLH
jgi:hypothetical protein